MMWSELHRPRSIRDMVGNEEPRAALVEWLAKWKSGTKPALLVGPPGIGKTTIAYLACSQFGYDMIGLNASDVRSKSRINEILGPVLGNSNVLGRPMIFVDEVDGIHGRSDFGGAEALIRILKESTVPIILAANSDSSKKMKSIKKAAKVIEFRPVPPRLLRTYLRHVAGQQGANLSPGSAIRIVDESRGDIRSMINTAQSLLTGFDPGTDRSPGSLGIEDGIGLFFKAKSPDEARLVLYSIRADPREKIAAFYSSVITSKLPPGTMISMLQAISDADMLYGRIFSTQQWRLLRYLDGILLRLFVPDAPVRYNQYNLPWPLLNRIRWDARTLREMFTALGARMHVSASTFGTLYFPLMLQCMKNKKLSLDLPETHAAMLDKEAEKH